MAQEKKANVEKKNKETMAVQKTGKVQISLVFDRKFKGENYSAGTVILTGQCADGLSASEVNLALQLNQLKAVDV